MPEVPVYIWGREEIENPHSNCAICHKQTKPHEGPVCERCRPHLLKKHKELQRKVTGGGYRRNPGLLTSKKERAKQYARLIVDYIKRKATPSELDELIKFINEKEKGLDNPLTKKEFDNIMAEARVHRKIPKTFYQGEASGMEDIAKQYKSNPPMVKIYNRILEVRASKEGMPHHCDAACKAAGHRYKHKFSSKACIYGLPDGSFLVK